MKNMEILNYGGIVPISTIEWYGQSSTVIFFRGCPFRCIYCHNKELQNGHDIRNLEEIKESILKISPFINAVVITGGEPCLQYIALKSLAVYAKSLNKRVGLYTAGYFPNVIEALCRQSLVDRVFLSIKAPLNSESYRKIIGIDDDNAVKRVLKTINILKRYKISTEIITPVYKPLFGKEEQCINYLNNIINDLKNLKYTFIILKAEGDYLDNYSVNELKEIATDLKKEHKDLDIRVRSREYGEENITL